MSVDVLLDDVEQELSALWGSGLALPGVERPAALRRLAARTEAAALARATGLLQALGTALEEGDSDGAFAQAMGLAVWLRTFRAVWSLEVARERLTVDTETGATARRVAGYTGRVRLVGPEVRAGRWLLHGLDEAGRWVVLADQPDPLDLRDPLGGLSTSRLFQDHVRLGAVLRSTLALDDHPKDQSSRPILLRPAFAARPRLQTGGEGPQPERVASVPRRGPPVVVTATWVPRPGGWGCRVGGVEVSLGDGEVLTFNLQKRWALGVSEGRVAVLPDGGGAVLLSMEDRLGDPVFPTVDPRAVRWDPAWLQGRDPMVDAWVAVLLGADHAPPDGASAELSWWLGEAPARPRAGAEIPADPVAAHGLVWRTLAAGRPLPAEWVDVWTHSPLSAPTPLEEVAVRGLCLGGPAGRALVEAHVAMLRRGVTEPDLCPAPRSLWVVADALARLRDADPRGRPMDALGLPLGVLRLAAVAPVAEWLSSGGPADREVLDALLLIAAMGDGAAYWTGR